MAVALAREPETGFQIIHVIPDAWGPYVDIRAMYQSLARRNPWTSVIAPGEFTDARVLAADAQTLFVHWQPERAELTGLKERRAMVAAVYSEAYDDNPRIMLRAHSEHLTRFLCARILFDCVFGHTPWMADRLASSFTPGFVLPVGWDLEAMGAPRWDSHKHYGRSFHGTRVGHRGSGIVTAFDVDHTGFFGRQLLGALDQSAISIYIAHSDVASFSTWRLWQCASTSCVLANASKSDDVWPFDVNEHMLRTSIATFRRRQELHELAKDTKRLEPIARAAHEVARKYTVDMIERSFIVPAIQQLTR